MAGLKTYEFKIIFLHFFVSFIKIACSKSTSFSLKLIPWDSPESPLYQPNLTQTQKVKMMVMSSKAMAALPTPENATFQSKAIHIPLGLHRLRYSVSIKIGTPSKEVPLLFDTGSGFIVTRCHQSDSDFNPRQSSTARAVPCQHPLCIHANEYCNCINEQCVCNLNYGAIVGSSTTTPVQTTLLSDSITLPTRKREEKTFGNIVFGCSNQAPEYSGILGLNKYPLSLISQVKKPVHARYSYCLHQGGGYLRFGDDIPTIRNWFNGGQKTKILYPNQRHLFLDLQDISLGSHRLRFPPALFSVEHGGFFIDTGARFTVLKRQAYDVVIQELRNYYHDKLERVNERQLGLELCYKYDRNMRNYATMTLHLKGAEYIIHNLHIDFNRRISCVALLPGEVSILGAYHQSDRRFIFDLKANTLAFIHEDCSKNGA